MSRLRWVPLTAGAWLVGAATLWGLGLGVHDAAILAALVIAQVLTGMVVWLRIAPVRDADTAGDRLEHVGMGVAIGTILAVLSGVLLDSVLPGHLGWLAPSLVALVAWFWPGSSLSGAASAWRWNASSLVAGAVAFVIGLGSIILSLTRYPLEWVGTWGDYHRDMIFFEGLSTSVAVFGPGDSIFMVGADIRYHWFAYAWAGQLAHTADAVPFATLTRVLPIVALIGCASLVTAWAVRLSGRTVVAVLAGLLLVAGGYLGAVNGTILNFDSPSQALTTVWLLGLLVAVLAYLRGSGGMPLLASIGLLSAGLAGGKISAAAVGLAPIALVALVASVRREPWARRAWLATAVAALAAGATYLIVVSGSASPGDLQLLSLSARASTVQGINYDMTTVGILLGTTGLVLAMAARWWGLAWLVGDRDWRWRPDTVLGLGLVAVSIPPVFLLSQGVNETWFALSASAPLAVLSAVGLWRVWTDLDNPRAMWASGVLALLVLAVVIAIWTQGGDSPASARFWGPWAGYAMAVAGGLLVALAWGRSRGRRAVWLGSAITILVISAGGGRALPTVEKVLDSRQGTTAAVPDGSAVATSDDPSAPSTEPVPPDSLRPPDRAAWSSAEVEAARFLTSASAQDDVVVTNETTSFLVPALVPRRTYMTGTRYQGKYGSAGTVGGIPGRIEDSLAFVDHADEGAFARLCDAGVAWMWVALDRTPTRSWEPFADVVFENEAVAVARLDRGQCP